MTVSVSATTTTVVGRYVLSARSQHVVLDGTARRSGPGEAPSPVEGFLGSLAVCAASSLEHWTGEHGARADAILVEVTGDTAEEGPARFVGVDVVITVTGSTDAVLDRAVASFRETCPVLATISAATTVTLQVDRVG